MHLHTACAVATLAWLAVVGPGAAQEAYPSRQITMVVPFTAASQPDILARALAEGIARIGGQPDKERRQRKLYG